jgi:hypothetical protein
MHSFLTDAGTGSRFPREMANAVPSPKRGFPHAFKDRPEKPLPACWTGAKSVDILNSGEIGKTTPFL